VIELFSF